MAKAKIKWRTRAKKARKSYRKARKGFGGTVGNVIDGAIVGAGTNILASWGGNIPVVGVHVKNYAGAIAPILYGHYKKDPFWQKIGGYNLGMKLASMATGQGGGGGGAWQAQV